MAAPLLGPPLRKADDVPDVVGEQRSVLGGEVGEVGERGSNARFTDAEVVGRRRHGTVFAAQRRDEVVDVLPGPDQRVVREIPCRCTLLQAFERPR